MLPDSVDAEGRLNVTTDLPDASSTIVGGVAVNAEGQIHITNVISDLFVNGLMVTDLGQLCFSAAPIDGPYLHGFPRKADGRLVGQADTTPDPKDPFVAGIRVGALGGIYSTYVAPPVGDVPVNTIAPDVTGDAIVGSTLTCSTGTWTGTAPITYTYRWYQGATPIIGATNSTYVAQAGDLGSVLICTVTATNTLGAASKSSNGIRMVNARYNYKNNAGIPAAGMISAGSAGAPLQVRIYETDLDGVNHSGPVSRMEAGDSIFINGQEGVLTEAPIDAGSYYICEMEAWPALPDGEYLVQLGYGGNTWTPAELFANGEQGAWYDPSDFSTMFQDAAGTTPVTAVEQPVGLILDKSKGLVLGAEKVTNGGTPFVNTTGWTYSGSVGGGLSVIGGELVLTCANTIGDAFARSGYATFSGLTVGDTYLLTATIKKGTAPECRLNFASSVTDSPYDVLANAGTPTASITKYVTATATTMYLGVFAAGGATSNQTAILVSASLKQKLGNHASQATATARPVSKADGSNKYDLFDGVDDYQTTALGGGATTAFFYCASILLSKVGVAQTLFSDTGANTGYRVRINASNQLELSAGNGTSYTTVNTTATLTEGEIAVITCWHDGVNLNAQINSGTVAQTAFTIATAGTDAITFGRDNGAATSYFKGGYYADVYVKDVLTAGEITSAKAYCASKAGVTL